MKFTKQLQGLRRFRETLRDVLFRIESGHSPTAGFITQLNLLLIEHSVVYQLIKAGSGLQRRRWFSPEFHFNAIVSITSVEERRFSAA